jgi:RNA polymerase sigma factor (sigma-70 family)
MKKDDKEACFLRLIEAHKGILYKICRLYQIQEEDQRDLLQEITLQLWASYDSFRGDSQFSSWMYRVALNTAIVFFRKRKQWPERLTPGLYPDLPEELYTLHDKKEQLAVFHKAVQQLNKLEKALIFLYMEGQPGNEIAVILGVSPVNVRVRLNRVKGKIQYIIKTMGYEF